MKKNPFLSIILFFSVFSTFYTGEAQSSFQYKTALQEIHRTGFYKITLLPAVIAKCKEDISDIRIADDAGKMVPYILRNDLPVFSSMDFQAFPTIFNERLKDSSSEMVVANPTDSSINSILLIFKNMSAYRTATLSGSDDNKKWFVIRENILLEEAGDNTSDQYIQSIAFPQSRYKFFKFIINDKGLLAVNFIKAGVSTNNIMYGKYLPIPEPRLTQTDSSNKHSYITIRFDDLYQIDRFAVFPEGPSLYKRQAILYRPTQYSLDQIAELEISPRTRVFTIPRVKTNILRLEIDNSDNEPLRIQKIQAFQLNQYLAAYLQTGHKYTLYAGDSLAVAPDYDLKYFADSLKDNLQEIEYGSLEKNKQLTKISVPQNKMGTIWLWVIIGCLLLLLLSLCFKMISAISNKDRDDSV